MFDECQDGFDCGSNNCPASLGFDAEVDCCYLNACPGTCGYPDYKGDYYCDDENNNCACEWDGGDCCGSYVITDYCDDCDCLDPDVAGSTKKQNLNGNKSSSVQTISKFTTKPDKSLHYRKYHLKMKDTVFMCI